MYFSNCFMRSFKLINILIYIKMEISVDHYSLLSDHHVWGQLASYIADEFEDLLSAGVVDSHNRIESSIADRSVTVSDVNGDFFKSLGRSRLAHIHTEVLNQASKLLKTFWRT